MKAIPFWVGAITAGILLMQPAAGAAPSGQFKISALKKTVAKDQSATQELPRGTTRLEEKKIVYQFEIQNQSTEYSQQDLKVRWIFMLERADGRSFQTALGEKSTVLPFGRPVKLETEAIPLSERTWQGAGGRTAELGQVIQGYGLQILTQEGQLLMEKYEPDSLKSEIQWQAAAPQPEPARGVRPMFPRRMGSPHQNPTANPTPAVAP